jgi:hypothetical protein
MRFVVLLMIFSLTAACASTPSSPIPPEKPPEYDRHYTGTRAGEIFHLSFLVISEKTDVKKTIRLKGELIRTQPGEKSTSPLTPDRESSVTSYSLEGNHDDNGKKITEFTLSATMKKPGIKPFVANETFFLSEKCERLKIQPNSLCLSYFIVDKDKNSDPAIEIEMRPKTKDKEKVAEQ